MIVSAAKKLLMEHDAGVQFHPFESTAGINDVAAAYAVQRLFVRELQQRHGSVAGYKIGLTSRQMQAMCGIDNPLYGVILSRRVEATNAVLKHANYAHLGLEFEIGVRMKHDAPATNTQYDASSIGALVDGVCAAIEVIDDRNADYESLDVKALIADNAWNAGAVLGEFVSSWPQLEDVCGTVRLGDLEVGRGCGRDVLGHPFAALAWLANQLIQDGALLMAGDIVLTGSIIQTQFPRARERFAYTLEGIGSVVAHVEG